MRGNEVIAKKQQRFSFNKAEGVTKGNAREDEVNLDVTEIKKEVAFKDAFLVSLVQTFFVHRC